MPGRTMYIWAARLIESMERLIGFAVAHGLEQDERLIAGKQYAMFLGDALTPPGPKRHHDFALSTQADETGYMYYYSVLDEGLGLLAYSTSDRLLSSTLSGWIGQAGNLVYG